MDFFCEYAIVYFVTKSYTLRSLQMKNNLKFMLMIAFFAVIFGFSENVLAQNKDVPMVGGFKAVAVNDKGVVDATNFAVKTIAKDEEMELKLDSIMKAEQQVVQGMNYRLLFLTTFADGGETYDLCLSAQVYRNLKNVYSLSSWESVECPEEE